MVQIKKVMMRVVKLEPIRCAICDTKDNATELYPSNFDFQAFNPAVFSARRLPDRIHYRVVKCNTCGLVRSDPIANSQVLAQLYAQSTFDYTEEVVNLKFTYGRYLTRLNDYGVKKGALLEIGCGSGFFLEEALTQGYVSIQGVEPSATAVAKASPQIRPYIICDIMRPGLFEQERFDVICLFQVLDHIPDPSTLIDECFRVLKPGGLVLCLSHNIEAASAKLLKDYSPIIDIEHVYLYSPDTISRIFILHGFRVMRIGSAWNNYTVFYLTRLIPLPTQLKHVILASLKSSFIGRMRLSVPLGNFYFIAQRPQ